MKKSVLPVLFLTIFIDLLGVGILIPVIPQLLANPLSSSYLLPKGWSVSQGYMLLGLLLGIFPLAQFFATPILGQLSDRYGRKKILGVSLAGTCASYILFAIGIASRNIPLLFFSRALDGVTGGNIAVAQASIADVTRPEDRAKTFGLMGAAFGIGFVLGPYIGGKLSDPSLVHWFDASTPFWFAALLSLINVMLVITVLPETHKTQNRELVIQWGRSIKNIIHAFNLKTLRPLFITNFLFQAGFAFYVGFFSVFLINRFHFTQGNIGDYFAYVGLWIAFTQAVVTRALSRWFKESEVLKFSLFGAGIAVMLFFLPTVWWELLLIVPLLATSIGLTQANLTGLVSRSASGTIQGEVLGINASVQALAQFIPPFLSGFVAARISPEAPLVISSITVIVSGVYFVTKAKKQPTAHE